ncbi:class I SAM-dependent methyltransferase [Frigoribacterium faeni]|uniref:16S RNA G1207 methylase RsmC n=1 Tax=Frigoribacterium faeni TaxID=145483 RepID=A0A7W3JI64_9MICO|nr:methyltransferase [Frigoribacterium faeni]MBA8813214.1 16S rRNA G1207 methylase RsmC [Frigoribacterium faeni]BFF14416.1 methyltransferase [Microbacterium flavescens]GEK82865.1 16S RNA G1207 methylase RsmC [Frigoribacterium faeni]
MASEHYFSSDPGSDPRRRSIEVTLAGRDLTLTTAAGVFSPDRVDAGTAVLLAETPAPPTAGHLLDVGCGWGPITLSLALSSPDATVWAVDVNNRVLDLVRDNARALGLPNVNAVTPDDVPDDLRFATIWSNPPIRVGKGELHGLLQRWLPRLETGSDAWLVVQKNLGSDSLQRWMNETMADAVDVTRASTSKGYRVLRARRH